MGFAPGWTFVDYLIHRNGEIVSTPPAGQQSYQDLDVTPGSTYTYWQTLNYYNFNSESDFSILDRFPRV